LIVFNFSAVAFGESWKEREERIKKTSPFAMLPGWSIFNSF
jgi:hypothetical protein